MYIDALILTLNCACTPLNTTALGAQLHDAFPENQTPELLIVSLQEVAPVAISFLGNSYVAPYLDRCEEAVGRAAHGVYTTIVRANVGMTALFVFAKDPSLVSESRQIADVGLGLWDMGNKGAVAARINYASTTLTFVAAHLAPHEVALSRRNRDWENLVRRLVFRRTDKDEALLAEEKYLSIYDGTAHLFVAGDLNYRTSSTPPKPDDPNTRFPHPDQTPGSDRHPLTLLKTDQLTQERLARRTCHDLNEEPITFPPTYKYEHGKTQTNLDGDIDKWPWASHRWPSWCDRILYWSMPNSAKDVSMKKYWSLPLLATTDHKAVMLHAQIPVQDHFQTRESDLTLSRKSMAPFERDPQWQDMRNAARRRELIIGVALYATTTWEGALTSMSIVLGLVGTIYVLRAMFGN